MDVLEHLTQEHRKVESLIEQLRQSEPGSRRDQLIDEMATALGRHMAVEEQYLYPIVVETLGAEPEEEAEVEHDLTREGLGKLEAFRSEPGFGAVLDMVEAGIKHHVEEEEHEVFPGLRAKAASRIAELDPEKLEAAVGLLDLSRDELLAKAREADVPGRSSMTKEELAEAVLTSR